MSETVHFLHSAFVPVPASYLVVRIDGVEHGPFAFTFGRFERLEMGGRNSASAQDHQIDNVTVGTTTWGATDVLSADGTSIVPPFDAVTGTGLTVSGSVFDINNAGADVYASRDWTTRYTELYAGFDVQTSATELGATFTPDFIDMWDFTGIYTFQLGVYADASGWQFYNSTSSATVTAMVAASTWYTLEAHLFSVA